MQLEDQRHADNQRRFEAIETKLDALVADTSGLVEFIRDSRVGLKWSGRLGRFLRIVGQFVIGGLTLYGAYQAWRNGLPNPLQK